MSNFFETTKLEPLFIRKGRASYHTALNHIDVSMDLFLLIEAMGNEYTGFNERWWNCSHCKSSYIICDNPWYDNTCNSTDNNHSVKCVNSSCQQISSSHA